MTTSADLSTGHWMRLDVDSAEDHPLHRLFYARSVAVVGASPKGGYGLRVVSALTSTGFAGPVYPVNPNYDTIEGLQAYPEIGTIPEPPDAVIIAVPSRAVPGVVRQAIDAGVKGGIALGSGFAEAGEDGLALQAELREICGDRFPLIGPNCLGIMNFAGNAALWSIPIATQKPVGHIGLVAQSGNMALTLMASSRGLNLAHAVSVGNQAVVDAVDVMSFFLVEPDIRVIATVIEGLSDIERFRKVAERAAERDIPVVALKLGRSEKASQAAIAHTGSMTGSDQLYDALFRQYGVIRVDDTEELMETAKLLAADRRPAGPGLGAFASSGGECGMVSDLAEIHGVELPDLPAETHDNLLAILPPFANPLNPLDITATGWGNREIYSNVATTLAHVPGVDIVAAIGDTTRNSGPLDVTRWDQMILGLADAREQTNAPIALINTITDVAHEMTDMLAEHGIIHLSGAANAVRAIGHAGRYARWRKTRPASQSGVEVDTVRRLAALKLLPEAGSGGMSESASKDLLNLYGIPVPAGGLATSVEDALKIARKVGYPVVLKIEAGGIHHKTEVGGVALHISSDDQIREEHAALLQRVLSHAPEATILGVRVERMASGQVELIAGGRNDPLFGPVVVAGLGGIMAEALNDSATRLAPITPDEARQMLSELRGAAILGPFRGRPAIDISAVADIIARVSMLLSELPEVKELDLNPILADSSGCIAVDGLVVV